MKKFSTLILCTLVFLQACKQQNNSNSKQIKYSSINEKIKQLNDANGKEILVVAHRADWRNAPENSLQAIKSCIDMGVDMVEIDVRKTKDNKLVVIHDKTLDRTTTGKGLVNEWTLDSLKTLYLKDGLGVSTPNKIPTLEEALLLAKDKILINLDKSYSIFDQCYDIIKKTGTEKQVIIKGQKSKEQVNKEFGQYLDKVIFMPVVKLSKPDAKNIVERYLEKDAPVAIEFVFKQDTFKTINRFSEFRKQGVSVWVNSLWSNLNGGHDDEKAVNDTSIYNWYIENDVNIIQTDRPKLLLEFLRSKGLHK